MENLYVFHYNIRVNQFKNHVNDFWFKMLYWMVVYVVFGDFMTGLF